ncbi:MAG: hypothetical protein QF830_04090 [Rhodospirillales bacterium]|nr:hypothetical protein [Rhodospirillales bacterium]
MKRAKWIIVAAVTAWLAQPTPANAVCGANFVELFNSSIGQFECVPKVLSLQELNQRKLQTEQLKLLRRQEQDARNRTITQNRQIRRQKSRQRQLLRQQQRLQAR